MTLCCDGGGGGNNNGDGWHFRLVLMKPSHHYQHQHSFPHFSISHPNDKDLSEVTCCLVLSGLVCPCHLNGLHHWHKLHLDHPLTKALFIIIIITKFPCAAKSTTVFFVWHGKSFIFVPSIESKVSNSKEKWKPEKAKQRVASVSLFLIILTS